MNGAAEIEVFQADIFIEPERECGFRIIGRLDDESFRARCRRVRRTHGVEGKFARADFRANGILVHEEQVVP